MHLTRLLAPAVRLRRLARDRSGMSMLEFALCLPVFLTLGAYGTELAHLALTSSRVSQYAMQIADNASRIGVNSGLTSYQLREGDINDVFQGLRLYSKNADLVKYGRVTLSSLENVQQDYDVAPVQRIHWQRCVGLRSGAGYDSTYGTAPANAGTTDTASTKGTTQLLGMGDAGSKVNAPPGTGVMFVEVNYEYQPLFSNFLNLVMDSTHVMGNMFGANGDQKIKLHYVASFIVRDQRIYKQVYNPSPTQTIMSCDKHTV